MCDVLEVSRSGYYDWTRRKMSKRVKEKQKLSEHIMRAFKQNKESYGSPRIYRQLTAEGITCGRHTVAHLMKEMGIAGRKNRKYKKPVTVRHARSFAVNVLNRQFTYTEPNRAWVSDVSYFWTHSGWLHLAIVLDHYSRRIVGWSMNDRVDKKLTIEALQMAITNRLPKKGLVHHSDQGAEYTNNEYQNILKENNLISSMSRTGNCYDNAVAESFFKTIKTELAKKRKFETVDEARAAIFEYIEIFYNRNRMHSTLGYVSPAEYERQWVN